MEKIKTDIDRLLSVSKMKKSSILVKYTEKFDYIIKAKSSPSTSVFIFSNISQILITKFYIFWTQTYRIFYFSHVLHALKRSLPSLNLKQSVKRYNVLYILNQFIEVFTKIINCNLGENPKFLCISTTEGN